MGDHADDAINDAIDYALAADRFLDGDMDWDEAMDHDFIGPASDFNEVLHYAADHREVESLRTINRKLSQTIGVFDSLNCSLSVTQKTLLEFPTCNICHQSMTQRNGKYGLFYFCECAGQPTVSDKYWQSVRKK